MSNGVANQIVPIRNIGQSVAALAVGFVTNVALSIGTDFGLHVMGSVPALDQPWSNAQLLGATTYRALYGVFSSYLVARLAPRRPLEHALIGGADWNGPWNRRRSRDVDARARPPLVSDRAHRFGASDRMAWRKTPYSADAITGQTFLLSRGKDAQ